MPELRVQTGPQKNQTFFLRPPGPYRFGRELEADFPLFDRRVSRSHFRIEFADEGYRLVDLASKAGTFVNDRKVEAAILAGGDRVLAGKTLLTFHMDGPEDRLIGRDLGGYRILERVGCGGMGTVYRALQLSLERVVAVKVLAEGLARDAEFSALFIKEARAAGELAHPNIVRVYDVNSLDGILFYVMEFMAQGSVQDLLRREGVIPIGPALRIALSACAGLEFAEREGVVHRDIKPANLMIHGSGAVKIVDLGIATRARDDVDARPGGISGSPHYMAPEQALGRPVDSRADIYSLGASIYQMITGGPPFRGRNLREIIMASLRDEPRDLREVIPRAPESLAVLLKEMLAKDPERRLPSPAVARLRIERILREIGDQPGAPLRAPFRRRRSFRLGLWTLVLFGLGAFSGVLVTFLGDVMLGQEQRLGRVRKVIGQGHEALRSGDVDGARRKARELQRLQASPDEWQLLGTEIGAFEAALKQAEAKGKAEGK